MFLSIVVQTLAQDKPLDFVGSLICFLVCLGGFVFYLLEFVIYFVLLERLA